MERKDDNTHAPSINYNVYYQNFVNVNNIINPNPFNTDDKAQKGQTFNFEPKAEFVKKTGFSEKAKVQMPPALLEIPSRLSSYQSIKDTPTMVNQKKDLVKVNTKELYEVREEAFQSENLTEIIGALVIALACTIFVTLFYAMIGSKCLGSTGNYLLDFIKEDEYYCYLVPLLLPVTLITTYGNWVAMKFFRHS